MRFSNQGRGDKYKLGGGGGGGGGCSMSNLIVVNLIFHSFPGGTFARMGPAPFDQ
jgi:hypothetical protein